MRIKSPILGVAALALSSVASAADHQPAPADLILLNTQVWTGNPAQPYADAVAIRGDRILAVGSSSRLLKLKGAKSSVIDLHGQLVLPGFTDAHTHFENATEWFSEPLLFSVNSEADLLDRLRAVLPRVPKGMWISGGDWGEAAARQALKRGDAGFLAFSPTLADVDAMTPDNPVLLRRHNGDYFANSRALKLLRINKDTADPAGGAYGRDPKTGALTGMLIRRAGERAAQALPPKSMARTLIAARVLMKDLNSLGITEINDISRAAEVSDEDNFPIDIERSHSDINIFKRLRAEGNLTVRVYGILPLADWPKLAAFGYTPGGGDNWIHYGALKSFLDGTLMYEPMLNRPNSTGDFTFRVIDPEQLKSDFVQADKLGWDMATHQLGDRAIGLYLDWVEAAVRKNGPRDRRERLIHLRFPNLDEIRRAGALHAFADITPFHMIEALDDLDKQLGPARAKTAFAGRTLIDNGVRINLVSDWPGDYYRTTEIPNNPLIQIYYAVVRHRIGEPASKAWHPEEDITIEEGLRAYTENPALAAHEEHQRGTLTPGKLADIAVLDRNILAGPPEDLLKAKVTYTIVGGKIVYRAP